MTKPMKLQHISSRMLSGILIAMMAIIGAAESLETKSTIICRALNRVGCVCEDDNVTCDNIGVTDLSFVTPFASSLQLFSASQNDLRELGADSLKGAVYLRKLNLRHNQIETVDERFFDSLVALIFLDMSHNRLVKFFLPSTALPKLDILYLTYNSLANVRIDDRLNGLDQLFLSHNELENNLHFVQNLTNLRLLSIGSNNISITPFSYPFPPDLHCLRLSNNSLTDLGFLKFTKFLWELDISDNAISKVPEKLFSELTILDVLNMAGNKIIDTSFLRYLPQRIKELDLSRNNIEYIDEHYFENKTDLTHIDVSQNKITNLNILFKEGKLQTLLADNNKIESVNYESHLSYRGNLTNLSLGNNSISDISFIRRFNTITDLNFANNKISKIDESSFSSFNKLKALDLSRNMISDVKFVQHTPSLVKLNLSYNRITDFPCNSYLKYIHLDGNNISSVQLNCNPHLRYVSMYGRVFQDRKGESLRTSREVMLETKEYNYTFPCFPSLETILECEKSCNVPRVENCDFLFTSRTFDSPVVIVLIVICLFVCVIAFLWIILKLCQQRRRRIYTKEHGLCESHCNSLQIFYD